MNKTGLLAGRQTYKPFLYPKAFDFWEQQQQAHWLPSEISMASDLQDWKLKLTEDERKVIAGVLKGFIQTEIVVEDYWNRVSKWFPHPEIVFMSSAFSNMESIHGVAYAYLNDSLGIEDYDAFLYEPSAKAKIDRLLNVEDNNDKRQIARSLAIFSAFTEGVSLYSSFAILFNFSRFNKMKGLGTIIEYSNKDEFIHSIAGTWLFREFIKENSEIWDDSLKKEIYEAARTTVEIEDNFIDMVFDNGNNKIEGLDLKDMKNFIRHKANVKLGEVFCKTNWKNVDQDNLKKMSWFEYMTAGLAHTDFFAGRSTSYQKGAIDWNKAFEEK
jgi:ribonucleoside-diphosphate reductase beta chain